MLWHWTHACTKKAHLKPFFTYKLPLYFPYSHISMLQSEALIVSALTLIVHSYRPCSQSCSSTCEGRLWAGRLGRSMNTTTTQMSSDKHVRSLNDAGHTNRALTMFLESCWNRKTSICSWTKSALVLGLKCVLVPPSFASLRHLKSFPHRDGSTSSSVFC